MRGKFFFTSLSLTGRRRRFLLVLYFFLVLAIGTWSHGRELAQWWQPIGQSISRMVWEEVFALTEWSEDSLADVFAASIPLWKVSNQPLAGSRAVAGPPPKLGFLKRVLGIQFGEPATYLKEALPLLALVPAPPDPLSQLVPGQALTSQQVQNDGAEEAEDELGAEPQPEGEAPEGQPNQGSGQQPGSYTLGQTTDGPVVFIYNTHTGETYARTDGVVKLQGKLGGVYQVGQALARALEEKHKLKVLQSDKIHDTSWLKDNPYSLSYITAKEALAANPSVKVVIDVHRDAQVPRESSLTKINGRDVARIMLVVGTNARNNHPDWMKNYLFAQKVGKQMEEMYPGLLRKIITKRGRYNQHLHPQAMLVEIGSAENSTEEAMRSAELFADVLAGMIQGKVQDKAQEKLQEKIQDKVQDKLQEKND